VVGRPPVSHQTRHGNQEHLTPHDAPPTWASRPLEYEWLGVESLTEQPWFSDDSRETFDGVLALSEQLATDYFAPHDRKGDLAEPTFDGETVSVIPEVADVLKPYVYTNNDKLRRA
jgi:hypothetical protein